MLAGTAESWTERKERVGVSPKTKKKGKKRVSNMTGRLERRIDVMYDEDEDDDDDCLSIQFSFMAMFGNRTVRYVDVIYSLPGPYTFKQRSSNAFTIIWDTLPKKALETAA
jgi:hypothetical protein